MSGEHCPGCVCWFGDWLRNLVEGTVPASTEQPAQRELVEPLSVTETARALGVSDGTVYNLLAEGALPEIRLGRRRLVPRWAVDAVVNAGRDEFDPQAVRRRLEAVA